MRGAGRPPQKKKGKRKPAKQKGPAVRVDVKRVRAKLDRAVKGAQLRGYRLDTRTGLDTFVGRYGYYDSPLGAVPFTGLLALGALAYYFQQNWSVYRARRAWRAGKWVRDNQLGGKMVFVPAEGSGQGKFSPLAQSLREADFAPPPPAAKARAEPPGWWRPAGAVKYPLSKERGLAEAKALLGQLEAARIEQGADYDAAGLLQFANTCAAYGVQVAPATDNAREAMYKAALEMAFASCVADSSAVLGGEAPAHFVSDFARATRLPPEKAWVLVTAFVSRKASALLVECAALLRKDAQDASVLLELLKLSRVLGAFPYARDSAEADMVAAGLRRTVSFDERTELLRLWKEHVQADPGSAEVLLGLKRKATPSY